MFMRFEDTIPWDANKHVFFANKYSWYREFNKPRFHVPVAPNWSTHFQYLFPERKVGQFQRKICLPMAGPDNCFIMSNNMLTKACLYQRGESVILCKYSDPANKISIVKL